MKILLANKYYYHRGGDCVYTMELEKLLTEKGNKVAMFSMQHPQNVKSEFNSYFPSEVDFSKRSIKGIFKAVIRPIYSFEVKRKFEKLLHDFQPDIVHLNNIHSQLSPILSQIAFLNKIPIIWTMHDYKLACPASAFLRNDKICTSCLNDKTSVIKLKCHKNNYLISFLAYLESIQWSTTKINKYVSKFISPSNFLKSILNKIGIPDAKVIVMHNFLNFNISEVQGIRKNYIVYVGRLSKEKGLYTLLQSMNDLPEINLKVIGNGPLHEDLVINYALNNVEYLGFQNREIIFDIISKAKFLVLPSECFDNNPLTVIEALICGTPVLGANIGGIPELVNATNGLLFEPFSISDLKEKIVIMHLKEYDYDKISEDAKILYSADTYYNKLLNIYNQALSDGINK